MTNVLWRCLLHCLESADEEARNLGKKYVKDTAAFLHTGKINLVGHFLHGNAMPADVEPEVDSLIDISLMGVEQRLQLLCKLREAHALADSPQARSVKTSDPDEHEFLGRIISCSDAILKLADHLAAMKMPLEREDQYRRLYPVLWRVGGFPRILKYVLANPNSLQFRSTCPVLKLAGGIGTDCGTRMQFFSDWWEVPELDRQITAQIPDAPRQQEWYEAFIPQHDGWTLSLGDYLDTVSPDERKSWERIFELAMLGSTPKPSKRFLNSVALLFPDMTTESFLAILKEIADRIGAPSPVEVWDSKKGGREVTMLSASSIKILRGIARIAVGFPSTVTLELLGQMMSRCFDKIPGIGPRCEALGQVALDSIVSLKVEGRTRVIETALSVFKKNKNVKARLEMAVPKCQDAR